MSVRMQVADDGTVGVVVSGDTLDRFEATTEADEPPYERAALIWGEDAARTFESARALNQEGRAT